MSLEGVAVWWVRRDLRLHGNAALQAAARTGKTVLPLYVLDPKLTGIDAEKRLSFLFAGLRALDKELRDRNSRLFVKTGDPAVVIPAISRQFDDAVVFCEEDYTPFARGRDGAVAKKTKLNLVPGLTYHHPEDALTNEGNPFRVFSGFRKKWQEIPGRRSVLDDELPNLFSANSDFTSEELPAPTVRHAAAGERVAHSIFTEFTSERGGLWQYGTSRNRVDSDTTSSLSPYIRFGMISAETLVTRARSLIHESSSTSRAASAKSWLNELIWREFYQAAIYHFPGSARRSFRPEFDAIEWNENPEHLKAWQEGNTGYPIVDASMRQLAAEGWIHNRCRMIVASFLVKDLLIDWRHGARWFMRLLVDGDTAANIGGWQWTAGTGLDAAPYFRVFNPVLQGKRFDPHGEYVRKWVPELRAVKDKHIHSPWESIGAGSGEISVNGYAVPIVDHAAARRTALAAFAAAKDRFSAENLRSVLN